MHKTLIGLGLTGLLTACSNLGLISSTNQSGLNSADAEVSALGEDRLAHQSDQLSYTLEKQLQLQKQLIDQQGQLSKQQGQMNQQQSRLSKQLEQQQQELNLLQQNFSFLTNEVSKLTLPSQLSSRQQQVISANNKLILGQEEWVGLAKQALIVPARVDTGARTSSLHATQIQNFERDGKPWLRFVTHYQPGKDAQVKELVIEAPYIRQVRIKQASGQEDRPVISLEILVGNLTQLAEFTLTDRTSMQFPMLLGRAFFMDIALVDVSQSYLQGKPNFPEVPAEKTNANIATEEDDDEVSSADLEADT